VTVHAPPAAFACAAYLGLLPSALGFVIWAYAVARLPLAVSTAALYLVPPVALIVSFVWLAEMPRPIALAGGAISVAGVILISRHQRNHHPTDVPVVDASEPQGAACA
jgi:drug/metabolite transporter (DMT)-like permease